MFSFVDENNFDKEILSSSAGFTFVNFWAHWSEECQVMLKIMKQIQPVLNNQDKIVQVDWDRHKQFARRVDVFGVPTLLIYSGGNKIEQYLGIVSKEEILKRIKKNQFYHKIVEEDMNLWEKIKSAFSGGVETISDKTVEWSSLAKLRWEHRNIQKSIEKKLNQLGGKVYQLRVEKLESQLVEQTKEIVDNLDSLEEQLHQKEQEIQDIVEKGVDKEHLKEFKKDLELGDGKIEQVAIKENTKIVGKMLMDLKFPKNVLIGAIVRNEQVVIPDGKTTIQIGDKVTLLGEKDDVEQAIQILEKI